MQREWVLKCRYLCEKVGALCKYLKESEYLNANLRKWVLLCRYLRDRVLSCRYLKESGYFCTDISKLVSHADISKEWILFTFIQVSQRESGYLKKWIHLLLYL